MQSNYRKRISIYKGKSLTELFMGREAIHETEDR
jgi:hypothetical protein